MIRHRPISRFLLGWCMVLGLLIHQTDLGFLKWVAWVGMLAEYSLEEGSIAEGAEKTFSGESPCSLCKTIDRYEVDPASKGPRERAPEPLKKESSSSWLNTEGERHPLSLKASHEKAQCKFPRENVLPLDQFFLSPPTPPPRTTDLAHFGSMI